LRHSYNNKALFPLKAGAKLQAKKAVGFFSTALGYVDFTHLHACGVIVPPYYIYCANKLSKKHKFSV
jgi:hypothetical protein